MKMKMLEKFGSQTESWTWTWAWTGNRKCISNIVETMSRMIVYVVTPQRGNHKVRQIVMNVYGWVGGITMEEPRHNDSAMSSK
jgi:hypothetical protein